MEAAGEAPPYVLMPHSMSALEAIYWASSYPEEVQAIIGLDMAVPESYQKDSIARITMLKVSTFIGFQRFSFLNPVSSLGLTEEEYKQHRLLNYRNALNQSVYQECKQVMKNASIVKELKLSDIKLLMFSTTLGGGEDESKWTQDQKSWVDAQNMFAKRIENCTQIMYHCDHNLQYEKSEEMAKEILSFLNKLVK